MVDIERINLLAKKQREEGLTDEEKAEQAKLRREYIDSVVGNLRSQLDNTYVVEGDKKIKLERGRWYSVAGSGNLTVKPINVRVE